MSTETDAARRRYDELRGRKDELDEDDYFQQLEDLLVEIAALDAAIRARESRP